MKKEAAVKCRLDVIDLKRGGKARLLRLSDDARGVRIAVLPRAGGEIASMRVRIGRVWREILYRGMAYNRPSRDLWPGRAPLLWPAVGRQVTPRQYAEWRRTGVRPTTFEYEHKGRTYTLPLHGFARFMAWKLRAHGRDEGGAFARCRLASNHVTRKVYPFDFELLATHRLQYGEIVSEYEVIAAESNPAPMPFCIGNHVGFNVPFAGKGSYRDCFVRSSATRLMVLSRLAVLTGRSSPINLIRKPAGIGPRAWRNTVIGGYRADNCWLELVDPASITVRVSQREKSDGQPARVKPRDILFVLYGKRAFKYYCPEPWMGRPNALNTGKGVIALGPGERFVWEMRITVKPGRAGKV